MAKFVAKQGPVFKPAGPVDELMWNNLNSGSTMKDLGYGFAQPFLPEDNLAQIASKMLPGSSTEYDEETDTWFLIRPDGSKQAINLPGPSKADAINMGGLAATLGAEGALVKGAQMAGPAMARAGNWLWNTAKGQGAVAGGTRAAQEYAGDLAAGQEIDIPWGGVVVDTFAGGVGTKLLNGLSSYAANKGRRVESVWRDWFDKGGEITQTGRDALESIGVNPDVLTKEQIRRVNATAPLYRGYPIEDQGRASLLASHNVRPTAGMVTQDPGLQMSEDVIIKSPGSKRGGAQLARFDEEAHQTVADTANDMFPPGASAAPAQKRLVGMKAAIADSFTNSYQNLRETGAETVFDVGAMKAIRDDLYDVAVNRSSKLEVDESGMFKFFDELEGDEVDFRELIAWRRKASKYGAVGQEVVKAFDEGLGVAQEMMFMKGDPEVVGFLKGLNDEYKFFKQKWDAGDLFSRLIAMDKQGAHLRVSPEGATNFLMNSSDTGWTTKQGLAGAIKKMKDTLGADSDEFMQLKWSIGRKAIGTGTFKESPKGGITTAGGTMRNRFQNAMLKRPQLMQTLFDKEELQVMDNLVQVADLIQRKPGRGGGLNSTTALGNQNLENLLINVLPTNEFQYIPAAVRMGSKGMSKVYEKFKPGGPAVSKLLNPGARGPGVPVPAGIPAAQSAPDSVPEYAEQFDYVQQMLQWLLETDEDQQ